MKRSDMIYEEMQKTSAEIKHLNENLDELAEAYAETLELESQEYRTGMVYEHKYLGIKAILTSAGFPKGTEKVAENLLYSLISLESGNRYYEPASLETLKALMIEEGGFVEIGHISDLLEECEYEYEEQPEIDIFHDKQSSTLDVYIDGDMIGLFNLRCEEHELAKEIATELSDIFDALGLEHTTTV